MSACSLTGNGNPCSVECQHIISCANKCPGCLSWCGNGLVAVGSGDSVVIAENRAKREDKRFKTVIKTLNHHKGRVNCVKWMMHNDDGAKPTICHYLLSGSTDKLVLIWKCQEVGESSFAFEVISTLKSHNGAITCLDGTSYSYDGGILNGILVISTAVDSTLKIWRSLSSTDAKDVVLFQTIDLKPSLALTISLCLLQDRSPLIACGLDNSRVSLYTLKTSGSDAQPEEKFSHVVSLQGHEDWVRGSDFTVLENGDVLLATSSQDTFIRLWKISAKTDAVHSESELDVLKMKEVTFATQSQDDKPTTYVVNLEAVLSGHEGWVYSVCWGWQKSETGVLRLVSSSMDKSVIVWKVDAENQIWVEAARFGEVGGNTLGFYGAVFDLTGSQVIAQSYNGALHLWEEVISTDRETRWKTGVIFSGHFGPVLDLSWEPRYGRFFVTTSADQTTRLFGSWVVENQTSWHEIARPQVHGYDMQCISMIDSFRFISGADEKVLRVFEAPENFIQNFENLASVKMLRSTPAPEGATVPALGLSNKAVFSDQTDLVKKTPTSRGEQYIENQFKKFLLDQPPTEEHLLQNSLWPETHKLYWHVYEIFCVATNSSGSLVASAAKSATPQHAAIVLWDTQKWKEVAQLHGHTLTVTQMEFSHNGRFLLSVSRDRTWILHQISGDSDSGYSTSVYAKSDKKTCHGRIIWSTSWSHDDKYFCTGSRDKKLMFWRIEEEENHERGDTKKTGTVSRSLATQSSAAITAVSFSTRFVMSSNYLLAIGKENGTLELHTFVTSPQCSCELLHRFDVHESHATTVKSLQWRPQQKTEDGNKHWIVSCGGDNIAKLFKIVVQ